MKVVNECPHHNILVERYLGGKEIEGYELYKCPKCDYTIYLPKSV
jgi:hypothetical protein